MFDQTVSGAVNVYTVCVHTELQSRFSRRGKKISVAQKKKKWNK